MAAELEVAITAAPAARASCKAKMETPPVPWTRIVSPGLSDAASKSACQAVTPAHGSVDACSNEKCAGIRTQAVSGSTTCSASTPSIEPPRAFA